MPDLLGMFESEEVSETVSVSSKSFIDLEDENSIIELDLGDLQIPVIDDETEVNADQDLIELNRGEDLSLSLELNTSEDESIAKNVVFPAKLSIEETLEAKANPQKAVKDLEKMKGLSLDSALENIKKPEPDSITLEENTIEASNLDMDVNLIALFGERGTGKTRKAKSLAKQGRMLYFDTEFRSHKGTKLQFPDLDINVRKPTDKRTFDQVFSRIADIDFDSWLRYDLKTSKRDKLESYRYIIKMMPNYLEMIRSGKYHYVVIDNASDLRDFALAHWYHLHKGRDRPHKFEWADIDKLVQDIMLPIIDTCQMYAVNCILCFDIADHYVKDINMGTKEDAKNWLLRMVDYELWLEKDYKVFCLKHPIRPYWELRDEDQDLADYLFDIDYINENATFKDYLTFKYETLVSELERREAEAKSNQSSSIIIG